MKNAILALLTVGGLFMQLLGFLAFIPLYITSPVLFLSLYIVLYSLSHRKRFKGF